MSHVLAGFPVKDSAMLAVILGFVPAILVYTKSVRIRVKDEFELTMSLRYKAEFWKRGSAFSQAMGQRHLDAVAAARSAEIASAADREARGLPTSSLDGAPIERGLDDREVRAAALEAASKQPTPVAPSAGNGASVWGIFGL